MVNQQFWQVGCKTPDSNRQTTRVHQRCFRPGPFGTGLENVGSLCEATEGLEKGQGVPMLPEHLCLHAWCIEWIKSVRNLNCALNVENKKKLYKQFNKNTWIKSPTQLYCHKGLYSSKSTSSLGYATNLNYGEITQHLGATTHKYLHKHRHTRPHVQKDVPHLLKFFLLQFYHIYQLFFFFSNWKTAASVLVTMSEMTFFNYLHRLCIFISCMPHTQGKN